MSNHKIETVIAMSNHKIETVIATSNNKIETVIATSNNKIETVTATSNNKIETVIAMSRQTADCGLGDSLDVITEYLTVTLGASLAESLTAGHEVRKEGGGQGVLKHDMARISQILF